MLPMLPGSRLGLREETQNYAGLFFSTIMSLPTTGALAIKGKILFKGSVMGLEVPGLPSRN